MSTLETYEPHDQYSTAINGRYPAPTPRPVDSGALQEHFLEQMRSTITPSELAFLAAHRRAAFRQDPTSTVQGGKRLPEGLGAGSVVNVWEQAEPPPRQFIIEGLVPARSVTALYGDGGQGKSLLALAIALHVILGRDFMGRAVVSGPVLFVDGELDAEEFTSRAYRVARGMGLDRPPEGLYYYQLQGPLTDPAIQAEVLLQAQELGVRLVILDSLTMSTYGADPKDAQDTIGIIKYLERVGTVLAIDHVTKPVPGANMSNLRQYGSVFKWNGARSVIQIIKAEAGGLMLAHKKTNFSALSAPLYLRPLFEGDAMRFEGIGADDDSMSGIDDNLPAKERVYRELLVHVSGAKPDELTDALGMKVSTVRNHLTTLRQEGRAMSEGGTWWGLNKGQSGDAAPDQADDADEPLED